MIEENGASFPRERLAAACSLNIKAFAGGWRSPGPRLLGRETEKFEIHHLCRCSGVEKARPSGGFSAKLCRMSGWKTKTMGVISVVSKPGPLFMLGLSGLWA